MGRAKISMKYIENEKSRKLAFRQRTKGLTSKISKLCNKYVAKACLIVYDGNGNNVEPMTWPEEPTIAKSILQEYEQQKFVTTPEIFDVNNYFEIKKDMVEAEITKVRKAIIAKKYPTWDPCVNNLDENQLKYFIATIDAKIQACNEKISMLKNMHQSETSFLQDKAHMENMVQESVSTSSHSSQFSGIQQHISHADLPPSSSTNKLCELVKGGDQIDDHEDWASQLADLDGWNDQLNDVLNCSSQSDQFSWQDLSSLPQN